MQVIFFLLFLFSFLASEFRVITSLLYRHVHGHFLWKYLCTWKLQINSYMMCTGSVPFTNAKLRYS